MHKIPGSPAFPEPMQWFQTERYLMGLTKSNNLRNTGPCANCLIVCGVVWLFVQQFVDFQTGLNFIPHQSGCATVWSVCGQVCELMYYVTTSPLIRLPCPGIHFFLTNLLSKYSFSSSGIRSLPPSQKRK